MKNRLQAKHKILLREYQIKRKTMKKIYINGIFVFFVSWLIAGCGSNEMELSEINHPAHGFRTDRSQFISTLDESRPTKEMRNAFIDEFIQKSDIQCQRYLNDPVKKTFVSSQKSELYMALFDTVSDMFGIKTLTDTAKELYLEDGQATEKTNLAYEMALTPEIQQGVLIARERYAQKILLNKYRLIESYTLKKLYRDMDNYDRLCNYETGLVEINNVLKQARKQESTLTPFSPKLKINPNTIKNKVEAVTIEANAKKKKKKAKKDVLKPSHEKNTEQVDGNETTLTLPETEKNDSSEEENTL